MRSGTRGRVPSPGSIDLKKFVAYAESLGTNLEELGFATCAGCNEELLTSIKSGKYVCLPYSKRSKSSTRSNHRSLQRAGMLISDHLGLRVNNINWARFDQLLALRNRIR